MTSWNLGFSNLPTAASQTSYWLAQALSKDSQGSPQLRTSSRADVCIVGGGYTGLWTAIELKLRDPNIEVVLLEAQICGSGASGTNAGELLNLWPKYPALVAQFGAVEATRLATESANAVQDVIDFVGEHAIDASVERCGWLWTATSPDQIGAWDETMASFADIPEAPFRAVSAEDAADMGGPAALGGVFDPTSAILQPAALARGLRRVAISLGVEIFEHSPVTALEGSGPVLVRSTKASMTADRVVLAVNAWASAIPSVRRHMVMTASDNLVTEPLPADVRAATIGQGVGSTDSRRLLNYWRPTADGRVLFGKGGVGLGFRDRGASSMFGPVPRNSVLRRHFERTFPTLRSVCTTSWRAPVEYSLTSLPFFHALEDNPRVILGAGYSGDGVGPSRLGGRILASLATGVEDEWSQSGFTKRPTGWLPPEPIRFLGGQIVRRSLIRAEDSRADGRSVDPVTSALTRLDPTSWV